MAQLAAALLKRSPPAAILREIDKTLSERSLVEFMRRGWRTIETSTYIHNWHIDAIADHLTAVADRKIKRLLINVPPRHQKSLSCGVFFPAWVWAQDPGKDRAIREDAWRGPGVKFLTLSHKGELAERDAMLSRRVMESPWYRGHWGSRVSFNRDENAKGRYRNTAMGARYTGSSGAGILGEGGDIIIVDDPHPSQGMTDADREKVLAWWSETLQSRLNDQRNGAFVVIMQRLHERDLSGHILARESGWDHLCLPATFEKTHPTPTRSSIGFKDPRRDGEPLWPARFGVAELDSLARGLGSYAAAGQLQQRPAPREGGMFKRWWFPIKAASPVNGLVVRRWDLAATEKAHNSDPDWTVGVRMRRTTDGLFWIEDVVRLRGSPAEVEAVIRKTAEQDGRSVVQWIPQDPGAAGKMIAQRFVRDLAPYPARIAHEGVMGSKINRADPFAAQCEAGNVFLVRGAWNDAFLEELGLFPNAAHDDQVDAASGAFLALTNTPSVTVVDVRA